jgi:D-serine deaminase-like pyridoxal phosphate-dependent protein
MVSVLATVNGHRADKGWTLIDAGWMALSRDRGTAKQPLDQATASSATSTAARSPT